MLYININIDICLTIYMYIYIKININIWWWDRVGRSLQRRSMSGQSAMQGETWPWINWKTESRYAKCKRTNCLQVFIFFIFFIFIFIFFITIIIHFWNEPLTNLLCLFVCLFAHLVIYLTTNNMCALYIGVLKPSERFAFCMCNPPFFTELDQASPNPRTVCTGASRVSVPVCLSVSMYVRDIER